MPRVEGRRRRRRTTVALALVLVGVGGGLAAWRAWSRLFPGPMARGEVAYARGDWESASSMARRQLATSAGDRAALRLLARATARLGRDEPARALFGRLDSRTLQAEDLYLLGTILRRKGDEDLAIDSWLMAIRLDPAHAESLDTLTGVFLDRDRLSALDRVGEQLARQPGWGAKGDLALATSRSLQADPAGASSYLKRALGRGTPARGAEVPPPLIRKRLARELLRDRKPAEARAQVEAVLAEGPDPEASWLLSRAAIQQGDKPGAVAALQKSGSYRDEHAIDPEPAPLVGSARCADCHRSIYRDEQSSRHARTFHRADELAGLPLPGRPVADPVNPSVTHAIDRGDGRLKFETRVGREALAAFVDYAFGSGDRGLSLVGRDGRGQSRELRLSRYADVEGWEVTTGQEPRPSHPKDYLGRPLSADAARDCLACHTTDAVAVRDRAPALRDERGIGCERCHGPGGNHLASRAIGLDDPAIARPGLASGGASTRLCGQCHTPIGTRVSRDDPNSVRFQSTTLTWSRCYSESRDAMSCVTCHDPHRDADTNPSHYESRCLSCHSSRSPTPAATCPVDAARGCVACHMPTVRTAIPHTSFTDHYIRIHMR